MRRRPVGEVVLDRHEVAGPGIDIDADPQGRATVPRRGGRLPGAPPIRSSTVRRRPGAPRAAGRGGEVWVARGDRPAYGLAPDGRGHVPPCVFGTVLAGFAAVNLAASPLSERLRRPPPGR